MGFAQSFRLDLIQRSGSVQEGAVPRFCLHSYCALIVILAVLECAGLQKCHSEMSH